jgi:stage V sporulation protein SpoVS
VSRLTLCCRLGRSSSCVRKSAAPNPQADADRLEAAAEQAVAACAGDLREAVKALIVANEFLEQEVCELMQAVSHGYTRGRFKTYTS